MFENASRPDLTAAPLDRADRYRGDPDALARLRAAPEARAILFRSGEPLLRNGATLERFPASAPALAGMETVFLGLANGRPLFACDVAEHAPESGTEFVEMRAALLGGVFGGGEASLAAIAKAVLGWHRSHRFCARCGAESRMVLGGWRRDCPACDGQHFPRVDPVAIMLITNGGRCAIARNINFPEGLYSCIAGFVEPGESVEDAVRRETQEELGLRVGRVAYVSSQPWPFPSALMLGCIAETSDTELVLEAAEIAAARWFTRPEIARVFAGEDPDVAPPRKSAIARTLLQDWVEGRIGFGGE